MPDAPGGVAAPPPASLTRTVGGTVSRAGEPPAPAGAGVRVVLLSRGLRSEQPLGETRTGPDGRYRISYQPPADRPLGDLLVRASDGEREGEAVRTSPGADPDDVDVRLPPGPGSEFARLTGQLAAALEGADPAALSDTDIAFLARATGRDRGAVADFAAAHRLAAATGQPAEPSYGLFRRGLPSAPGALARRRAEEVQAALDAAAEAGVTGPAADGAALLDAVRAHHLAEATGPRRATGPDDGRTARVFAAAVPDPDDRHRLYAAYLDHGGDTEALLAARTEPETRRLALALRLGDVTGDDPALLREVLDHFAREGWTEPREVVRLDEAWPGLLERAASGTDPAEPRARAERAHPTAYIAHRLARETGPGTVAAARFLAREPGFDLLTTPVDSRSVPDHDARAELAVLQRTYKVTRRYDAARAVREAGFASSAEIAAADPGAFAERLAGELPEEEARAVHARATRVHATAAHLVTDLRTAGHFAFDWLPSTAPAQTLLPDWEELFGPAGACVCPDCRSVHGQPAYLVDLLYFLKRAASAGPFGQLGESPMADALHARRPDLWRVRLTCDNTDIPVPYVDLVNEVLEEAVAPDPATGPEQRQTSGDAATVRVQPQWTNYAAYNRLRGAVFPWTLPFDLWSERARAYLGHLDVPRHALMTTLHPASAGGEAVTAERLGTTVTTLRIITGPPGGPAQPLAVCYGRPPATPDAELLDTLSGVRALLDASGLGFTELEAALDTRFVNPGRQAVIESTDPLHPCDTGAMRIGGLTTGLLDRLHRFTRLRRLTDWSAAALDRVVHACTPGTLDPATTACVAAVRALAERLDLPPDRLLTCCAPLDTHLHRTEPEPPLYDRLFLAPTVAAALPGAASPFTLNADRTEVAVVGDLLDAPVSAALLGVLEITDADLAELVTGPRAVVGDTRLTLAHLSALTGAVTLARAVHLTVADTLRLVELRGGGPLASRPPSGLRGETELAAGAVPRLGGWPEAVPGLAEPELPDGGGPPAPPPGTAALHPAALLTDLERFADEARALRAQALSVPELDAVLTCADGGAPAVPPDSALAATLDGLRSALRAVRQQTEATTDDSGELTGKHLALLGWDAAHVAEAVATLLGSTVYPEPVANTTGSGILLPPDIPVRFEPGETGDGRLLFTGPMTLEQRDRLSALATGAPWQDAVRRLFEAPRLFVTTRMKAFRVPVYTAPLGALPADYAAPEELAGRVFHDPSRRALCAHGYLTPAQLAALCAASGDGVFKSAVEHLGRAQEADPGEGNRFLARGDADALFDTAAVTPGDRFHRVLSVLTPELRRRLGETTVTQHLGQAAGTDNATAGALLATWLRSRSGTGAMTEDFLAPGFTDSDPAVALTRSGFPGQFTALSLLHRVALALSRLRVRAEELPWVIGHARAAGWLDLAALPPAFAGGASPLYRPALRLLALVATRDRVPGGGRTLGAVLAAGRAQGASADRVLDELAARTGWNREDLGILCASGMLEITLPGQLGDERGLAKLAAAVELLRRLGVSAARAASWIPADLAIDTVQAALMAARARHTPEEWPTAALPMQDALRDRQRQALVAYLLAHPAGGAAAPRWKDTNGLFGHFLLDVEMGSCQLTTRIAQAVNSVQLFVQRVLLNLEIPVTPGGDITWREWDWMKQYQLWVANQKVFLYPENYLQPDLRTAATPFFTTLTNELAQKEVRAENMAEILRAYVERLDGIARLQPCGIYHDHSTGTEVVHLFACTDSTPRTYHHRRWIRNRTAWTPWEKLELDIDTPALVPVVWNGRLYLFWPTFLEAGDAKPITALPSEATPLAAPPPYWNVQLNWSQYAGGTWQAKRVTKQTVHTYKWPSADQAPPTFPDFPATAPYRFHPVLDTGTGDLTVWCVYNEQRTAPDQPGLGIISGGFRFSPRAGTVRVDPTQWVGLDDPRAARGQVVRPPFFTRTLNNECVELDLSSGTPQLYIPDATGAPGEAELLRNPHGAQRFRLQFPVSPRSPAGWLYDSVTFTDGARCYVIVPVYVGDGKPPLYRFLPMYHPHVDLFVSLLNTAGTDALHRRDVQLSPASYKPVFDFTTYGLQSGWVTTPLPSEAEVDFTPGGSCADYNWELFFHIPLLIAQGLGANQRFADAQKWFHKIFDPTDRLGGPPPGRYWVTKPFHLRQDYQRERIEDILHRLATGQGPADVAAVEDWLAHPFQPDAVARLRTTAYQKATVMKYLDNLIAWGDQLFRQDTLESLNQATQLYVLAAELLGERPPVIPDRSEPAPLCYFDLRYGSGPLAGAFTAAERLVPVPRDGEPADPGPAIAPGLGQAWADYFRVPPNEKLLGYWDTVEDRLFKIRNCRNIEGAERAVPLFGAPVDPALLAAATAAGADLATVLDDISAPVPHYRFATMAAKAKEYAAEVKAFGAALLSALEKRDAEALARLRSGHELAVLDAARDVRLAQIDEAGRALAALGHARDAARAKCEYYTTREYMNTCETLHTVLTAGAMGFQFIAAAIDMTVSVMRLLPELKLGSPTTIGATWGGTNLGEALRGLAGSLGLIAASLNTGAGLAATHGGYRRRYEEWVFQAGQADAEIKQRDEEIAAATVRREIARRELANHDLAAANAREADRFLHTKFTGEELYDWMAGQLASSYFQAYQLAYDMAKRAERAFQHECGTEDGGHIRFGSWDTRRHGLLAGERLAADLNRLEAAYLETNAREFELTKRVSLAQTDPAALLALKETGTCYVSLPEALFDLDTPGHYARRIKAVAVTVPCVSGPYTGVHLTATLLHSTVRTNARLTGGRYARGGQDPRFRDRVGPVQSIVTSTGQEDSGLFATDLRDERFLPFEGAGAVGEWRLSLPAEFRQFDYQSITDVVLHLRYTARDGGPAFARTVVAELRDAVNAWARADGGKALSRAFSARREFGDQWAELVSGKRDSIDFALSKRWFPHLFRNDGLTLVRPRLVLVLSPALVPDGAERYIDCYPDGTAAVTAVLTDPGGGTTDATLTADPRLAGQPYTEFGNVTGTVPESDRAWRVTLGLGGLDPRLGGSAGLNPDAVLDLLLIWDYTLAEVTER